MRTPTRSHRVLLPAVALALSVTLAGCGDSDDGGKDAADSPKVFSESELEAALLTVADIGEDYRTKEDDGEDTTPPGCMSALDMTRDGFPGAEEDVETTIEADTESAIPEVDLKLASFEDAAAAEKSLADLAESFVGCTEVSGADDDGIAYDLEISSSARTSGPEVDSQLNLDMEGTVGTGGQEFPVALRIRFVQVENVLAAFGISSIVDTDTGDETDELTELGLQRVVALIEGEDQPEIDPLDLEVFTG